MVSTEAGGGVVVEVVVGVGVVGVVDAARGGEVAVEEVVVEDEEEVGNEAVEVEDEG